MRAPTAPSQNAPGVTVYVDEYGDRGFGPKASPYFCVTAVVVPQESHDFMRAVVGGLRHVVNTPKALHWVDHFTPKHQHRRDLASLMCAQIPGLLVVYALAEKRSLISSTELKKDGAIFYHYVTKLALERAAFSAAYWPGGRRTAKAVLAEIKNVAPDDTRAYFEKFRSGRAKSTAPTSVFLPNATIATPQQREGLQLADLYQGMFAAALQGDPFDADCARHLIQHRHQIRRSSRGDVLGYGIKIYGNNIDIRNRCWWQLLHN